MSRLSIFVFLVILLFILEKWKQDYPNLQDKSLYQKRLITNIGLSFISSLVLMILPFSLAEVAQGVLSRGYNLFNFYNYSIITQLILLDLFIYLQHRLSHAVPFLWKFHRIHHYDTHLDFTTALRFHPLEILLSFLFKVFLIFVWGFSIQAIFWFEILLNSFALFNHSNIKLPPKWESTLGLFFITPKKHKVHHSDKTLEHNSTYGFSITLWDYLFKSFSSTSVPKSLGLGDKNQKNLKQALLDPFTY